MKTPPASERCQSDRAAAITGYTLRSVQARAAKGLIPGAAKLGGIWTFDEAILRRWVRSEEEKACRVTSIAGAASGGPEYRLPASNTEKAYAQLFASKRSSASSHGVRK